ncbi:MAG: hypothetical protein ACI8Z5_002078 [Lentimonas sp.]|jgi:hypothetical protein
MLASCLIRANCCGFWAVVDAEAIKESAAVAGCRFPRSFLTTKTKVMTTSSLDQTQGIRVILRNLPSEAAQELKKLRFEFKNLGTTSMMNDYLRNIYRIADSYELARTALILWYEKAETSDIACLKKMAKTIRKRIEGLVSFWRHHRITSASQEGFNTKIGSLTRQAYGYKDEKHLYLKTYDLLNLQK